MKFAEDKVLVSGLALAGSASAVDGVGFTSEDVQVGEKAAISVGVAVPDQAVSGAITVELGAELSGGVWDTQAFASVSVTLVRNESCRHTVVVDCSGVNRLKVLKVTNSDAVAVTGIGVECRSMVG